MLLKIEAREQIVNFCKVLFLVSTSRPIFKPPIIIRSEDEIRNASIDWKSAKKSKCEKGRKVDIRKSDA